jgi:hypothetical protein
MAGFQRLVASRANSHGRLVRRSRARGWSRAKQRNGTRHSRRLPAGLKRLAGPLESMSDGNIDQLPASDRHGGTFLEDSPTVRNTIYSAKRIPALARRQIMAPARGPCQLASFGLVQPILRRLRPVLRPPLRRIGGATRRIPVAKKRDRFDIHGSGSLIVVVWSSTARSWWDSFSRLSSRSGVSEVVRTPRGVQAGHPWGQISRGLHGV